MSLYTEREQFAQAHRECGELAWWTTPPTAEGYGMPVACHEVKEEAIAALRPRRPRRLGRSAGLEATEE